MSLTRAGFVLAVCVAIAVSSQVAWATANGVGDFDGNSATDLWNLDSGGMMLVTKSGEAVPETWTQWSTLVTWYDVQTANVNGDLYDDVVGRTDNGVWWAAVSNGSAFTNQFMGVWAPVPWNDVLVGDVNNDDLDDVIGRTDNGVWWAAVSNGSSFTNQFMGVWAPISWNDVETGDVNGDGLDDVIGRTDDGNWWAGVSDGSFFTNEYMGTTKPYIEKEARGAFIPGIMPAFAPAPTVPEPSALGLLGFGLLLGRSRRRK